MIGLVAECYRKVVVHVDFDDTRIFTNERLEWVKREAIAVQKRLGVVFLWSMVPGREGLDARAQHHRHRWDHRT